MSAVGMADVDLTVKKDIFAMKVLVVGAGGFAGGFIVAEGLRRGYEM